MSIVITGATGNLGRATVDALLARGVSPSEIVATGRNLERLTELAARGVRTVTVDLDDPGALAAAHEGATRALLVSVPGNPRRVEQHTAVIEAARAAGVELLAYTSFLHADRNPGHEDHVRTEQVLRDSGVPFSILRDGVYLTYFTRQIDAWRQQGRIIGAGGDGRISAASHADLGAAAADVLTTEGHAGTLYELGNRDSFTLADVATELSLRTGEAIEYVDLSPDDYRAALLESGQAEAMANRRVETDLNIAAGGFLTETGDLERLVGRPLQGLGDAFSAALA